MTNLPIETPTAMSVYGDIFRGETTGSLVTLAGSAVILSLATVWVLIRRSRAGAVRR